MIGSPSEFNWDIVPRSPARLPHPDRLGRIAAAEVKSEPFFAKSLSLRVCGDPSQGCYLDKIGTILVVEDDRLIQALVEDALSEGGFQSAFTVSGEEAIALLRGETSQYRAVVTDINLVGKVDGWEVAHAAREIDPAMPVLYMTGTHGEEWASKGVPNSVVLAKPFAPAQIVTAVAQLLNASPPTTSTE
jgi:CheY-like chemotaxis protein